jgi:hypothetical protein
LQIDSNLTQILTDQELVVFNSLIRPESYGGNASSSDYGDGNMTTTYDSSQSYGKDQTGNQLGGVIKGLAIPPPPCPAGQICAVK